MLFLEFLNLMNRSENVTIEFIDHNESLDKHVTTLMSTIDDIKEKITSSDYLKLSDLCKDIKDLNKQLYDNDVDRLHDLDILVRSLGDIPNGIITAIMKNALK